MTKMAFIFKNGARSLVALAFVVAACTARAECFIVRNGVRKAFDGKGRDCFAGLAIEKKSMLILNTAFPTLNIIERTFKAEILTCTACVDNYVTCK